MNLFPAAKSDATGPCFVVNYLDTVIAQSINTVDAQTESNAVASVFELLLCHSNLKILARPLFCYKAIQNFPYAILLQLNHSA